MARLEIAGAGSMAHNNSLGETLFQLGMASSTGRDGQPDLIAAHKWFNLAAMQGHEDAAGYRQEIAFELTTAEVAAALKSAREWLRAH